MSPDATLHCIVYKSTRRADTYVYVLDEKALERLPPELKMGLDPLVEALRFELTPERRLARIDAQVLRKNLHEIGFHIQFPPAITEIFGDARNLGKS